jgi:DNA-binding NarL/FixJ family response regulator
MSRLTVLVADDHPLVRQAAVTLLKDRFDVVADAADGLEALELARTLRPDVVVLDIAMPGLDGLTTAARIRSEAPARIVFLSSFSDDDHVLAALSGGATGFVSKRSMAAHLAPAVEHALGGRTTVPSASVLRRWPRVTGRRHDIHLYDRDSALIENLTALARAAFDLGDSFICVALPPHHAAFEAQCASRSIDLASLARAGRYVALDAQMALDGMMIDGSPDAGLYEARLGPIVNAAVSAARGAEPHVTAYGEIAPILLARGEYDAMLHLEHIADDFVRTRPMSLLCGYPAPARYSRPPAQFCEVVALHSAIVAA